MPRAPKHRVSGSRTSGPRTSARRSVPCAVLLALAATGQPAAQVGFATVTTAGEGERVSGMLPCQRAVTQGADGKWYVLVLRTNDAASERRGDLELWGSAGGRDWAKIASAPTANDERGCLVADPDHPRLHVLWMAAGDTRFGSVYFATLDLASGSWLAEPECLATATGADDQYFPQDLCIVGGQIAAAIGAHRSPKTAGYSGWGSCLRLRSAADDAATWSDPVSISAGSAGIGANLASHDGLVHATFRTYLGSDHCIATRTWDATAGAFVADSLVRVAPLAGETRRHTNHGMIAIDQLGHRYVFTALGSQKTGDGQLVVSHAAPKGPWASLEIADDPQVIGGNYAVHHIALARGPGNQMFAFFSKKTEAYRDLYLQILDQGTPVGEPRLIESGAPGAFEHLSGVRNSFRRAGVQLVVSAGATGPATPDAAPNEVRVYGLLR